MANTITNIMPKLLVRGLRTLREQVRMPRLVNGDYSADAVKQGDVINIPVPKPRTAKVVTPAAVPPTPTDSQFDNVQIPVDQWYHEDFFVNDKEAAEIMTSEHFIPMTMAEAIRALANQMNQHIMGKYTGVYSVTGTAGTTPFASAITDAIQARKILNETLAPKEERRGVVDFAAEANMLNLAPFRDASQSTDRDVIIEGEIGRKLGFDWFTDDHILTHTAGTGASMQTAAAGSVGDSSIAIDTGTGTLVVGDVISFAGHTQTYAVSAAVADVSSGTVSFTPTLKAAVADNAAITKVASHVVNLGFNKFAFGLAMRSLAGGPGDRAKRTFLTAQDPVTGIVLRLELIGEYKQTVWDLDVLWGANLVRPELAVRILG